MSSCPVAVSTANADNGKYSKAAKWVAHCTSVGKGLPALQYLSRYLYRGVIRESNIIANHNGKVTFQYTDSRTGKTQTRTLKGESFLYLLLLHVLPKGFRRVRDYGFLHANAAKQLTWVQLVLQVFIQPVPQRQCPAWLCPQCHSPMVIQKLCRPAPSG